ncbi:MAG: peptide-methionine (S)-S-oxide reductase MsrA [Methanoregulaceae archaeon]|nr:peptide-methionine (S)-S-oxide reductase MsrA [Methanoregulaceae archaeon]
MSDDEEGKDLERATFGGGCFWGVEAGFRRVKGVVATAAGFMGGHDPDPTYMQVCEGDTGHTEVVQVIFDPKVVSYEQLLGIFFDIHDPTTLEGPGPDIGRQYRSVIFYHSPEQKAAAGKALAQLQNSGRFRSRITTAIEPASEFYLAEDYHQQFFEKCGRNYCATPRNMEE